MIQKAILKAYQDIVEKGYKKIYWCIDLHGVCFQSNYQQNSYEWINPKAIDVLRQIQFLSESIIIIWTSCHEHEIKIIDDFLIDHGIYVKYFNHNPEVENTETGCFDSKFYMSVILDDKAGFDPDTDWDIVSNTLNEINGIYTS